ncbi:HINT domain-containing protein [Paenibacillus popilliae]|uniref:HINT domain-containing protein n=1 Tax=Paenibacillus popilliae TaxID=78057 RepID=UPI0021AF25A9|nr:HINT domain-containing protein [Paenibacillus sp. SDF0028]
MSVDGKYAHTGQCADQSNADYYMDDRIVMAYILPYMSAGVVKGFYNNQGQIEYLSSKEQNRQTFWETYSKAEFNQMKLELPYTDPDIMFATITNNSLSTKGLPKFSAKNKPSVKVGKTSGCNCFTAGTKVQTDDGEKNIEDIEVGDKVLAKDEDTGEVGYKEVTATFNHETGTDEVYKIHIGGQVIEATFNHPFWVDGQGWTIVEDLEVGDLLIQSDGNKLKIESIELGHEKATVYQHDGG